MEIPGTQESVIGPSDEQISLRLEELDSYKVTLFQAIEIAGRLDQSTLEHELRATMDKIGEESQSLMAKRAENARAQEGATG